MRKRMISPAIWTNRKFIRCSDKEKLLFIGLFSTADDHGKLWYDLMSINASILPCDKMKEEEIRSSIKKLADLKLIITDEKVIKIHGWTNHQSVPKPQNSNIPEPRPDYYINDTEPLPNQYSNDTEPLPNQYSNDTEPLPNQYSNDTEPLPNQYSNDTEPLPNQYSNDTEPLPNQYSNHSEPLQKGYSNGSVQRKKEKKKIKEKKKEMKESNLSLINKPNEKDLSTKEVRNILFKNKGKFNKTEYESIESLIAKGKHLSARIKIDEKITET